MFWLLFEKFALSRVWKVRLPALLGVSRICMCMRFKYRLIFLFLLSACTCTIHTHTHINTHEPYYGALGNFLAMQYCDIYVYIYIYIYRYMCVFLFFTSPSCAGQPRWQRNTLSLPNTCVCVRVYICVCVYVSSLATQHSIITKHCSFSSSNKRKDRCNY